MTTARNGLMAGLLDTDGTGIGGRGIGQFGGVLRFIRFRMGLVVFGMRVREIVEFLSLVRRELFANFLTDTLRFFSHFLGDGTPKLLRPLLAAGDDFFDVFMLLGSQAELAIHAVKQFPKPELRGIGTFGIGLSRGGGIHVAGAAAQQIAGHHAGGKYHQRRNNDLPCIHRVSPICSVLLSTAASRVVSTSWDKLTELADGTRNEPIASSSISATEQNAARENARPHGSQRSTAGRPAKRAMILR